MTDLKNVWLDADPGHDDATAIMLAIHLDNINLLGVSTVHGNGPAICSASNAARCLHAFGAPKDVLVFPGAVKPLIKKARHDPEIHGADGLGGVVGLPSPESVEVQARFARHPDGTPIHALEGMSRAIRDTWKNGAGRKVSVVSCGPMTNIALFVSVYPELLDGVEQFVFMGGAVGLGNRSPVAEFNIICDPEATQIVLDAPVKTIMVPLNVTHMAIATNEVHSKLRNPSDPSLTNNGDLPLPSSALRHTLSTLISFFADTYRATFGFNEGPPLHDPLTVAYVSQPELFKSQRYRVDVELHGIHTAGETVVDVWHYRSCDDSWGANGKNCLVTESVQVERFFDMLSECVSKCDKISPLNLST
ncbi:Inosine/uridine-preferring nucleoside hydrolase domain-containing protein [Hygrophoropsis aurantiaca]|uniref:Inosine/uridine-preferring nucleoside hydrolase domain-containing protein n=1 Tax=Hygrophoropsis aurantiaca TaxID=72124 RepID=A0ACB8AT57_9AGAM|nr:Inosine/uridine-preferring nucleoside hydrolase domain-containing protein [Hygrophoropsis aurantiaca]